jgi:hypothetical protein
VALACCQLLFTLLGSQLVGLTLSLLGFSDY